MSPGFCATVFADNLGHVRHLTITADGTVYANRAALGRMSGGYDRMANTVIARQTIVVRPERLPVAQTLVEAKPFIRMRGSHGDLLARQSAYT